jgi:hypothetical protein
MAAGYFFPLTRIFGAAGGPLSGDELLQFR